MPQQKLINIIAIAAGLLVAAFIVYAFYDAYRANPQDPFKEFIISKAFLTYHSAVFALGAAVWIAGTLVFLLELAGYTLTPQGLRKSGMGVAQWSVIDQALAALSAAVYGALLVATAPLVIFPGFTWLRPANSLAPLFGMFFGIPGCFGAALGNLIADIVGGYFGVGSIGGFVGNFLIAYLPYKLVRDHTFSTTTSIGEFYVWGVLVQAIVSAVYICWWLDLTQNIIGLPIFVTWGVIAPTILSNNVVVNAILSPILGRVLYPLIKGRGLYWRDRIRHPM